MKLGKAATIWKLCKENLNPTVNTKAGEDLSRYHPEQGQSEVGWPVLVRA